jgi:6-pyruvoyltetrahydropterin/6-carboxytetrahydropterin synthase
MSVGGRYTVRVTKDHLVFSAGHFITYSGDHCERIHGHNYRVAVEVDGGLDENGYVVDFIALLEMSRGIVAELDHRMLCPTGRDGSRGMTTDQIGG